MSTERQYPPATSSWGARRPSEVVHIRTGDGRTIGRFPLAFVRQGGANTWAYLLDVVRLLVDCDPALPCGLVDSEGDEAEVGGVPVAGRYVFVQTGRQTPLTFTRGPEYFSRVQPANVEGSSTRSHSSRATTNQNAFRIAVIARDAVCLVTDEVYNYCEASHIVPQSRPDVYQRLLDLPEDEDPYIFDPTCGLLLRKDLHRSFDLLEFSFYKSGDDYYLHAFHGPSMKYHGKKIPPDRFHGPARWRPDPTLLAWHYAQCAKARIRGFSAGMAPAQASKA